MCFSSRLYFIDMSLVFSLNFFYEFGELHKCQFKKIDIYKKLFHSRYKSRNQIFDGNHQQTLFTG